HERTGPGQRDTLRLALLDPPAERAEADAVRRPSAGHSVDRAAWTDRVAVARLEVRAGDVEAHSTIQTAAPSSAKATGGAARAPSHLPVPIKPRAASNARTPVATQRARYPVTKTPPERPTDAASDAAGTIEGSIIAAVIAIQSQRNDPTGPGPSIDAIPRISRAAAIHAPSANATSAAGRRSVRGTAGAS